MSQRMDYDEPGGQQQVPPFDSYQSGYKDPFASSFGQKIPSGRSGSHTPSASQRLALAIVSLCLLVPLISVIIPVTISAGSFAFIGGLIAIGAICITIIAVNFLFNREE
ncbi:MAG TPA: hypothetical protein VNG51_01685 [Ktedonobacteraceae bacterium]|nr:hypothetical protein [Ktedonobacteraceae bacterium]